jgi:hypothetical protein
MFNYLAILQGGEGPDVWDREFKISAADFRDAAGQAASRAETLGGQVVSLEQNDTPMDATRWLIWSHAHTAWWRPDSKGYCKKRQDAGRYSYQEACEIVNGANHGLTNHPHEAMVLDTP